MTEFNNVSEQNNVQVQGAEQEPSFPLSVGGVAFLLSLLENAASRGEFPIHSYIQVADLYGNLVNFYNTHVPQEQTNEEMNTNEGA